MTYGVIELRSLLHPGHALDPIEDVVYLLFGNDQRRADADLIAGQGPYNQFWAKNFLSGNCFRSQLILATEIFGKHKQLFSIYYV